MFMLTLERENFVHYWMRQIQASVPGTDTVEFFTTPEAFDLIVKRQDLGNNDFNFRAIFPEKKTTNNTVFTPIVLVVFPWQLVHHFIGEKKAQDDFRITLSKVTTIHNHLQAIDPSLLTPEQPYMRFTIDENLQPSAEMLLPEGIHIISRTKWEGTF